MPIALLVAALWSTTQETINFADKERAGVVAMRSLMPVFLSVLEVRNATRSMLGGFDATKDHRAARERTDKAIGVLKQAVLDSGEPIGIADGVAKLEAAWTATEKARNGADDKGPTVFGPVTTALVDILIKVADDSNPVLAPDVDSFYRINALVLAMPGAAEDLGQV